MLKIFIKCECINLTGTMVIKIQNLFEIGINHVGCTLEHYRKYVQVDYTFLFSLTMLIDWKNSHYIISNLTLQHTDKQ